MRMLRLIYFFLVENQCHIVALNMYYSVSTTRCVFAMSQSLQRNSWNAAKENGREKIIFAHVDGASNKVASMVVRFLKEIHCVYTHISASDYPSICRLHVRPAMLIKKGEGHCLNTQTLPKPHISTASIVWLEWLGQNRPLNLLSTWKPLAVPVPTREKHSTWKPKCCCWSGKHSEDHFENYNHLESLVKIRDGTESRNVKTNVSCSPNQMTLVALHPCVGK